MSASPTTHPTTLKELVEAGLGAAVSPQEAANLIGVSRPTIYRLIDTGQLHRYKVAGAARLNTLEVLALVGGAE